MKKLSILILAIALGAIAGAQIDKIIKVGGIALAVSQFGPQMNDAANKLQGFKSSEAAMTKVVPIISVGKGVHSGAAQIMGPKSAVSKVKAVAQLETDLFGKVVRIRALIPIESDKDLSNMKRVVGVGVSAVIDIKL